MLTSVVEVDDLNGARKVLLGEIPDPHRAIADHYFLVGPTPAAPPSFVVQLEAELLGVLDGSNIRSGLLVTHRAAVPVGGGLREHAAEFDLARVRRLAVHSARATFGLGLYHRNTRAVHFDIENGHGGSANLG